MLHSNGIGRFPWSCTQPFGGSGSLGLLQAAIVDPDVMPTLALSSDYFRLTVRVTIGTYSLTMYSLLQRDSSGRVRPLIRTFGSI